MERAVAWSATNVVDLLKQSTRTPSWTMLSALALSLACCHAKSVAWTNLYSPCLLPMSNLAP
jgi:hypothetical protein